MAIASVALVRQGITTLPLITLDIHLQAFVLLRARKLVSHLFTLSRLCGQRGYGVFNKISDLLFLARKVLWRSAIQ
jgi:hypothetical protein